MVTAPFARCEVRIGSKEPGNRIAGGRLVEVVASTIEYRHLSDRVLSSDRVVEIGCSWGHCTELLAARASDVLGMDCSRECIEVASVKLPSVRFARMDALEAPEWLRALGRGAGAEGFSPRPAPSVALSLDLLHLAYIGLVPAGIISSLSLDGSDSRVATGHQAGCGFNVAFVDIGGSRCLRDVVRLVAQVEDALGCEFIAVKSEELFEAASKVQGCNIEWWRKLRASCSTSIESKRLRHPLDSLLRYPSRRTSQGVEICRFANYGVCHKGDQCRYDHYHCHCCLGVGHKAAVCPLFSNNGTHALRKVNR